jgi:tetratricopeptide (TPR) repeat protein
MDAKERHELKDNDLAEFLQNFGEFWNKHGNSVSVIILVVLAAWIGLRLYNNMQATQHENAWADLSSTTTPQGYRERAREHAGDKALPQIALLRGAEQFHQQAIDLDNESGSNGASTPGMMSAEDSLKNAEDMYKQVLDSKADPAFRANAAAGLANVSETRGDFTAAREYWTQAEKLATDAHLPAIAAQAKTRLGLLEELARPIVFGTAEESTEPATGDADTPPAGDETGESEAQTPPVEASPPAEAPAPAAETPADPGQ